MKRVLLFGFYMLVLLGLVGCREKEITDKFIWVEKRITINNAGAGFWHPVPALLILQGLGV